MVVSAGGEAGADPLAQAVRRKDNELRLTSLQVTPEWRGERLSCWAVGLLGCWVVGLSLASPVHALR